MRSNLMTKHAVDRAALQFEVYVIWIVTLWEETRPHFHNEDIFRMFIENYTNLILDLV